MRRHAPTAFGVLLLVAACAPLTGVPSGALAPDLDELFELRPGASVTVGRERVVVGFDRVTADSRCPRDVQCIHAGEATVRAWLTPPQGSREDLELSTRRGGESAVAGGYTLTLTAVDPVPVSSRPLRASEYRATFRLARAQAP